MKKYSALTLIFLVLLTSTASAAPEKRNDHADTKAKNSTVSLLEEITVTPEETITITPTEVLVSPTIKLSPSPTCDKDHEWVNHGGYVSCVAKQHLGGQMTSEAARTDIGKKVTNTTPSVSPSGTPSGTITPTVTITATPPLTSAVEDATLSFLPDFGKLWKNLLRFFSFSKHDK
jgi:hypothetical protein